jgi:hypothetical protein
VEINTLKITALREDERGYALIANFEDGFALGWKMAVPEAFKEALDIKLTPRNLDKKQEMLWTQGRLYGFREGDIIHDVKDAYKEWGKALQSLKLSVQVQSASPSSYEIYKTIEIKINEVEIIGKKNNKPNLQQVDGVVVQKQRINHGIVKFKVSRPNKAKSGVEECGTFECTQDHFVVFLQTGIVRTKENKLLNLFAENS